MVTIFYFAEPRPEVHVASYYNLNFYGFCLSPISCDSYQTCQSVWELFYGFLTEPYTCTLSVGQVRVSEESPLAVS